MKAIALLSGGLDSIVAIGLVQQQGIDVVALNFTSPFCTCTSKGASCSAAAAAAANLGVQLKVIAKGIEYFKIVEDPKFGYGRAMNPCIDCRIYIIKKAREVMEQEGASFLITGEVIGQRPKSQHKQTLRLIEKEAGVEGLLVRPLSARLLPETIPEKMGWLDREKLMAVSGRGRKPQMEMAEDFGINDYPCPAGGCLLTDAAVARRLQDLFARKKDYNLGDLGLLRFGRHFRVEDGHKLILSKNQDEGKRLYAFFHPDRDVFLRCLSHGGPHALLQDPGGVSPDALAITHAFSKAGDGEMLTVQMEGKASGNVGVDSSMDDADIESMLI